ncbi:single-stranded DNA-binding protein [Nocardiopsis lucentensis]|uniref:single-stranded DNA-binding protein n=1 Tax=Nocardiopsis lucentensis TaxID=53441 RepID=UPI0003486E0D|nr:single-stranded DNA-binding protein [Nocardiopsis lucentensis]
MALPSITHIYRLASDPEVKFLDDGKPMVRLRLAANANRKNENGQWEKTDELFITTTAFGGQAQAIADANLSVGQEVIVTGRLRTRSWEQDGQKRSVIEMKLDAIGPKITPPRQGGGFSAPGAPSGGYQPAQPGGFGQAPANDPWGGQGGNGTSEPPF